MAGADKVGKLGITIFIWTSVMITLGPELYDRLFEAYLGTATGELVVSCFIPGLFLAWLVGLILIGINVLQKPEDDSTRQLINRLIVGTIVVLFVSGLCLLSSGPT